MAINSVGSANQIVRGREFGIEVDQESQLRGRSGNGINDISQKNNDVNFVDNLKEAINKVDGLQKTADQKIEQLATGQSTNIHETMIAVEKADISLKLMTQVRNKIIDAYQEVMKMQV